MGTVQRPHAASDQHTVVQQKEYITCLTLSSGINLYHVPSVQFAPEISTASGNHAAGAIEAALPGLHIEGDSTVKPGSDLEVEALHTATDSMLPFQLLRTLISPVSWTQCFPAYASKRISSLRLDNLARKLDCTTLDQTDPFILGDRIRKSYRLL